MTANEILRPHLPFVLITAALVGSSMAVRHLFGVPVFAQLPGTFLMTIVVLVVCGVAAVFWYPISDIARWRSPEGAWVRMVNDLIGRTDRGLPVGIYLVGVPLCHWGFTGWKTMIPYLKGFSWDSALYRADLALHGGVEPWQRLGFLLTPSATGVLEFFYLPVWGWLLVSVAVWQAFSHDDALRCRFFLTWILCWVVLGIGGGIIFSSAGPIFYGRIVPGPNPFAPLITYLENTRIDGRPFLLVRARDYLWQSYVAKTPNLGSGISAMPSLHVAMATCYALLGWAKSRRLAAIFTTYLGVVMLGSVLLGWHYAIDGYVAVLATIGIWLVVGCLAGDRLAVRRKKWGNAPGQKIDQRRSSEASPQHSPGAERRGNRARERPPTPQKA